MRLLDFYLSISFEVLTFLLAYSCPNVRESSDAAVGPHLPVNRKEENGVNTGLVRCHRLSADTVRRFANSGHSKVGHCATIMAHSSVHVTLGNGASWEILS